MQEKNILVPRGETLAQVAAWPTSRQHLDNTAITLGRVELSESAQDMAQPERAVDQPIENWLPLQSTFTVEVRQRILARLNYTCQLCGAQSGRTIVKRLMGWPDPKVPWRYVDGHPEDWPWDGSLVVVRLYLEAPMWPWDGNEATVQAFCFACLIHRETERIIANRAKRKA